MIPTDSLKTWRAVADDNARESRERVVAAGDDLAAALEAERERVRELEAGLRELREGADRAVLDLKHDAVVGAPWVSRVSNDTLERPCTSGGAPWDAGHD